MRSKALIFGISGQDGSLLADFLLKKNYKILGVTRNKNAQNLKKLYFLKINNKCQIIEIKKFDYNNINKIISDYQPDEIYNLSAQSSVSKSFNNAILTFKSIIDPNIYILESINSFSLSVILNSLLLQSLDSFSYYFFSGSINCSL